MFKLAFIICTLLVIAFAESGIEDVANKIDKALKNIARFQSSKLMVELTSKIQDGVEKVHEKRENLTQRMEFISSNTTKNLNKTIFDARKDYSDKCEFVLRGYKLRLKYHETKAYASMDYVINYNIGDINDRQSLLNAKMSKLLIYKEKARNCTENLQENSSRCLKDVRASTRRILKKFPVLIREVLKSPEYLFETQVELEDLFKRFRSNLAFNKRLTNRLLQDCVKEMPEGFNYLAISKKTVVE